MIELLTANTPNGKKISIMLEEIKFNYKVTKVLDLSNENLHSLPDSIVKLGFINNINLSKNNLDTLPDSFKDFKFDGDSINYIKLDENKFKKLPDFFEDMAKKINGHINLSYNNFSSDELEKLEKLNEELEAAGKPGLSFNTMIDREPWFEVD